MWVGQPISRYISETVQYRDAGYYKRLIGTRMRSIESSDIE